MSKFDQQPCFKMVDNNESFAKKDEFLSEILKKYEKSFPVTVEFSDKNDHKLMIGSELRSTSYFPQLSLVETYEDIYLLGNPISEDIAVYRKSTGTNYALTSPCEYYNIGDVDTSTMKTDFKNSTQPNDQSLNVSSYSCIYESVPQLSTFKPVNPPNVQPRIKVLPSQNDGSHVSTEINIPPKRPPPVLPETTSSQEDGNHVFTETNIPHKRPPPILPKTTPSQEDGSHVFTETNIPPKRPPPILPKTTPFQEDGGHVFTETNIPSKRPPPVLPKTTPSQEDGSHVFTETIIPSKRPPPILPKTTPSQEDGSHDFAETNIPPKRPPPVLPKTTTSQIYVPEDQSLKENQRNTTETTRPQPQMLQNTEDNNSETDKVTPSVKTVKAMFEQTDAGKKVVMPKKKDVPSVATTRRSKLSLSDEDYGLRYNILSSKIIRIHTYSLQKRVVCEVLEAKSKDLSLTDIIDTYELPVRVQFTKADNGVVIPVDSREISTKLFNKLELKEVYEEVYLLGNPITFDIAIYSATRFDNENTEQYTFRYPTEYYTIGDVQTPNVVRQDPRASGLYEDLVPPQQRKDPVCLYEPVSFIKRLSVLNEEKSHTPPVPLKPDSMEDTQTVALPVPRRIAPNKTNTEKNDETLLQTSVDLSTTENNLLLKPPVVDRSNKPILSNKSLNLKEFEFEYNTDQLSVKEFYKLYKNDLPKLAMTLHIQKCLIQKRVIAEVLGHPTEICLKGQKLSIPVDIEYGKDLSLREIVKKHLPVEVKFPKSDKNRTLTIGSDHRSCLYGKVVCVPAHLPNMKLCIITGIKGKSNDEWKSYLSDMQDSVEQKVNFTSCSGNKDIAIYDSNEIKIDSEFPFVSPNIYTDLEQLLQGKIENSPVEQISCNVYDEIPADKVKDTASLKRPASVIKNPTQLSRPPKTPEIDTIPSNMPTFPLPKPSNSCKKAVLLPTPPVGAKPPVPLPVRSRKGTFNVTQYSINDISSCLHQLKLDKYIKRFADGRVDGVILAELDLECLQQDFKLKKHQAIKLLNFKEHGHIPRMERSEQTLSEQLESSDGRIDVESLTVSDICDSLHILNLGRHC
ncbi:hypothetical protein KUTeg_000150 [Tegillarca granosa]|uniref:SAM domain-containing protein n=1 Tax=Tegillarca granosa TaxID=220873 RepID=A0ABQ9FWQ7_TEGGR|nr:hypothetical protein KUTeg_000150 [Tegillarca granosa]